MKKVVLIISLIWASISLQAQSYKLLFSEDIPSESVAVLQQRFTQMLKGGGLEVADAGTPLEVTAKVASRMETPGSMSQVALVIELTAKAGEVSETFSLKGVGEGDSDAWLRAVKQFLPKSKSALSFVEKLK